MKVPEPRKLPSGNWFIQLRLSGESVPITAPTAKQCRDKAALIKAEHRAGKQIEQRPKSDLTLREAIDKYISDRENSLSPSTIHGYRAIQSNRFQSVADMKLNGIENWQRVCNKEAKLCAAKTLKNAWGFVASVLKDNGVPPPNIKLPQVAKKTRPWLDYEENLQFLEVMKDKPGELPALLALSSLRRSEISAITPNNIDLKRNRIIVKGAKVQNEKSQYVLKETNKTATSQRVVPILIPRLGELLAKEDFIINVHPETLRRRINRACRAAGLPEVGVHGLRHSFASLAYHLGMPEKECMRLGGWSDAKTMHEIYTHIAERDSENYAEAMRQFYENANKNANENKESKENQQV